MGNATNTAKQAAILTAIAAYDWKMLRPPGRPGGGKRSKRQDAIRAIAEKCGASVPYVARLIEVKGAAEIGRERIEKEAKALVPRAMALQAADVNVTWFCGWQDAFQRLGALVERLQILALDQQNIWADAFLAQALDTIEKAKFRARRETQRQQDIRRGSEVSTALVVR